MTEAIIGNYCYQTLSLSPEDREESRKVMSQIWAKGMRFLAGRAFRTEDIELYNKRVVVWGERLMENIPEADLGIVIQNLSEADKGIILDFSTYTFFKINDGLVVKETTFSTGEVKSHEASLRELKELSKMIEQVTN